MAIWSEFRMGRYRDGQGEEAPHFTIPEIYDAQQYKHHFALKVDFMQYK